MNRAPVRLFAVVVSCSCLTGASDPVVEDWLFSAEAQALADEVDRKFEAIEAELQHVGGHDWAGVYYEGDGLGRNVSIALGPEAGVATKWTGCLGRYGSNHGGVSQHSSGELTFEYEGPNRPGFGGFPERVVPIRWDERRYLIPSDQLVAFVNAINLNREPRARPQGSFLLADGDEGKLVSGLPTLPADYSNLIRTEPLIATVVSMREFDTELDEWSCSKRYELTLDRGARDGLVPGVELETIEVPEFWSSSVTITSVATTSAVASLKTYAGDCASLPTSPPPTDWQVTTGAFDVVGANQEIASMLSR